MSNQFEQHRRANAWLMGVVIAIMLTTIALLITAFVIIKRDIDKSNKSKVECQDHDPAECKILKCRK